MVIHCKINSFLEKRKSKQLNISHVSYFSVVSCGDERELPEFHIFIISDVLIDSFLWQKKKKNNYWNVCEDGRNILDI